MIFARAWTNTSPASQGERLLRKYWSIPERQIETSVVLANAGFRMMSG